MKKKLLFILAIIVLPIWITVPGLIAMYVKKKKKKGE